MSKRYPIFLGETKAGSKDAKGNMIAKGVVRVKCPEEFVTHKIPVTYDDVQDQIKKMKKATKYDGDKKVGTVFKVDGKGKGGKKYAYCNAVVKIKMPKDGRKKRALPQRLKKWHEAVAAARSEGFEGRLKKDTPLYERALEIMEGHQVAPTEEKVALAEDADIERDVLELAKEVERQKEQMVLDEGMDRTSLPEVEGKSVAETITENAIDAAKQEVERKRTILKEYAQEVQKEAAMLQEEPEAMFEEGELEEELKEDQRIADKQVRELFEFECKKEDIECWKSLLEDIQEMKRVLAAGKTEDLVKLRNRASGNVTKLINKLEDSYERNFDKIAKREEEIMSMMEGAGLSGGCMGMPCSCGCRGGCEYCRIMEEDSSSDDDYVGMGLVPTLAEHKLMMEMKQRAKFY